jgi:uncharacterized membrane protein YraQ (UPF0718 family)
VKVFDAVNLVELAAVAAPIDELAKHELERALLVKCGELSRAELATVAGFVLGVCGEVDAPGVARFLALAKGQGAH